MKALLNGAVSARTPKRAREAACAPQKPALPQTACSPCLTDITDAGYNRSPVTNQKTLGSVKTMAAAEAWGAALLMAQLWVLTSVAA